MKKANEEIRDLMERRRIRHYEVAQALHISPERFSRLLRYDLTEKQRAQVEKAIQGICERIERG